MRNFIQRCDYGKRAVCLEKVRMLSAGIISNIEVDMALCRSCFAIEKEIRRAAGDPPAEVVWLNKKSTV